MAIKNFEELEIWKEARELAKVVRELTKEGDFKTDYRFSNQMNAAAGSVMDNIAEGFDRDGNKEFIQFLYIAKGSNGELRAQSYRAYDAQFIAEEVFENLLLRTASLKYKLNRLITYLKSSEYKGNKYAERK
ncbi:four helix bundle protein [Anditalea andensis]|uniref:30S ribosomal protein S23 n=1 Tax=Anditalea andensis TaxID=1048983 RepID=A0A074KTY3_9BACT|nr:four helix bundle protein [Anditalea andensis]KEO71710.1 30S ribosomal protein S23 [Anditalea andensis]